MVQVEIDRLVNEVTWVPASAGGEANGSRPCRHVAARAATIYAERFADPDGRVRATLELVHVSGWAPHDSQQKPLRPGSAQARLADALRVRERKLEP